MSTLQTSQGRGGSAAREGEEVPAGPGRARVAEWLSLRPLPRAERLSSLGSRNTAHGPEPRSQPRLGLGPVSLLGLGGGRGDEEKAGR